MKIKKILLVNPPGSIFVQPDGTRQTKEIYLPIGLAYLASTARASGDYEIKIYDMVVEDYEYEESVDGDTVRYGTSYDRYREVLQEFDPDFVGISCILSSRSSFSLDLLKITKEYNSEIITAVGGHHAGALPEHMLGGDADYVFLGEADHSFPKFLSAINSGGDISGVDGLVYKDSAGAIINQPKSDWVKDIEKLPYPAWDIVGLEKYWKGYSVMNLDASGTKSFAKFATVMSSRGCPHICEYCAVPAHTGKRNYRRREVEDVIAEVSWLFETYGLDEVYFGDDDFFVSKIRTKELLRRLIELFPGKKYSVSAGMDLPNIDFEIIDLLKQAGFNTIYTGIETAAEENIGTFVDKRITVDDTVAKINYMHQVGLSAVGFFMLGFPGETREQVQKTVALAESLPLDKFYLIMVTPLPGSEMYDYCVKNDLLYDDFDITKVRYSNTFIKNKNIPRAELEGVRKIVWDRHFGANRG